MVVCWTAFADFRALYWIFKPIGFRSIVMFFVTILFGSVLYIDKLGFFFERALKFLVAS